MGQARHLKKDGPSTRFAVALRDWHVYAIRNHLRYGGLPARVPEGQILKEELGKGVLGVKAVAIFLMMIGLYLIYI